MNKIYPARRRLIRYRHAPRYPTLSRVRIASWSSRKNYRRVSIVEAIVKSTSDNPRIRERANQRWRSNRGSIEAEKRGIFSLTSLLSTRAYAHAKHTGIRTIRIRRVRARDSLAALIRHYLRTPSLTCGSKLRLNFAR